MSDEMTLGELDALMRRHSVRLEYLSAFGVYRAMSGTEDGQTWQHSSASHTLAGAVIGLASRIEGRS